MYYGEYYEFNDDLVVLILFEYSFNEINYYIYYEKIHNNSHNKLHNCGSELIVD